MAGKHAPEAVPQFGRLLGQRVVHRVKELRKLLLGPGEYILGKQPAARTEFQDFDLAGRAQGSPYFFKLSCQQPAEDCMDIAGSIKVSCLAKLFSVTRVVSKFRMVQTQFHVPRKRNRPVITNFLFDNLAETHKPFRWRSARSCGVRMNISTM